MRALGRFERNRREAIRTIFGRRRGSRWFLHPVNLLDKHKNREGDDYEIQNIIEEDAVIQRRGARCFCGRNTRIIFAGQVDEQIREIHSTQRQSGGIRISSTNDVTILPNATPITTPTARSTTLPLIMNSLNSLYMGLLHESGPGA